MAVSTVKLNGTTLMTVNDTTATDADVAQGKYFYGADGVKTAGTSSGGGGGGGSASDDVVFIDYDGTVLHSYSASDFQALSAMPANPSHTGLTAQGWNWTLADAKAQVTAMGRCIIGQMYITDDGKTRVYIHLEEERKSPMLGICPNGTVDVDWGDGSTHDTLTGTSLTTIKWTPNHEYAHGGDYVIKLTVTGTARIYGSPSSNTYCRLLHYNTGSDGINNHYMQDINRVELGSGMEIGDYAFYNCRSLASITIPNSVTSIGTYAFYQCYSFPSITIPSGVTSIGTYMVSNCATLESIAIPKSVTNIGTYAFYYCQFLTYIAFPSGMTSVGTYAFSSCASLTTITIPSGVTSIPNSLFYYCYSLTTVIIQNGATSIGNSAFFGCQSLKSITIPNSVTSIGTSAFSSCYTLTSVTFPSGLTSIGNEAFNNCHSLPSVTIPSSVTSLGERVFYGCWTLTSVTFLSSATSLGNNLFNTCYTLTSITIPSSVTSIGTYVFNNCYSLAKITVPSGVTSIGNYAFQYCYGMKEYHMEPTTPPTLSATGVFTNISSDCKIYVPYSADHSILEAYQTATNWSSQASKMVEEEP